MARTPKEKAPKEETAEEIVAEVKKAEAALEAQLAAAQAELEKLKKEKPDEKESSAKRLEDAAAAVREGSLMGFILVGVGAVNMDMAYGSQPNALPMLLTPLEIMKYRLISSFTR